MKENYKVKKSYSLDSKCVDFIKELAKSNNLNESLMLNVIINKYVSENNNKFAYFESLLNEQNNNKETR